MADPTGGLIDWLKSKITDPSTGSDPVKNPPVGTGGRKREQSIDDAVDQAAGGNDKLGRMRAAQSTDRDNSFSY